MRASDTWPEYKLNCLQVEVLLEKTTAQSCVQRCQTSCNAAEGTAQQVQRCLAQSEIYDCAYLLYKGQVFPTAMCGSQLAGAYLFRTAEVSSDFDWSLPVRVGVPFLAPLNRVVRGNIPFHQMDIFTDLCAAKSPGSHSAPLESLGAHLGKKMTYYDLSPLAVYNPALVYLQSRWWATGYDRWSNVTGELAGWRRQPGTWVVTSSYAGPLEFCHNCTWERSMNWLQQLHQSSHMLYILFVAGVCVGAGLILLAISMSTSHMCSNGDVRGPARRHQLPL